MKVCLRIWSVFAFVVAVLFSYAMGPWVYSVAGLLGNITFGVIVGICAGSYVGFIWLKTME